MTINTAGGFERTADDARNTAETLQMRSQGLTYREIGHQLGIDASTAQRRVKKALSEIPFESVQDLRTLEGDRLDALMSALWPMAMVGNTQAVRAVLSVMDRRARLFGLDKPYKVELESWSVESIDAEVERLARLLGQSRKSPEDLSLHR